jgi:uncharacterized protein YdhG (YjbR/CyaY superfamily)
MAERKSAKKATQQAAKRATGKTSKGFTDEERAAMKERAQELKAEARRRSRAEKEADAEKAVLAKIAEMPEPDRVMAERLHAIIKASAPDLSPRTWYGMPAYAKDGKVVCTSQLRRSSRRGTRRSASTPRRTSTKAPCGRPPSR